MMRRTRNILLLVQLAIMSCAGAVEWGPQYDTYYDTPNVYSESSGAWRAGLDKRSSEESAPTDKRNMQHIWRNVHMNMPQQSEINQQKRFDFMNKRDEEVSHYYDKRAKDVDRLIRFGKSVDDEDDEERLKRFHPLKQRPFHPMGKRFEPISKRPAPRRFDTAHYRMGKRGMRSNGKNFNKFE